jgi:glycosyltransferase involved in cell wall biosynthesis|tara:strand:- start:949 stop:1845 length:897 start_codon:yes stop_codon:yes gene_type:complete
MKNKEKLVSIILNCYNGEQYLRETLNSVKNQTYKNWELIFWDNKSTDKSKIIFSAFQNNKFKYFESKRHTSLYAARNLAMKKAKGDFVSFVDADDTWEKDKLKLQIKLFDDKDVGFVYGNIWLRKEHTKKIKKFINYTMKEGHIYKDLIKKYNIFISTAIIRQSFLKKINKKFNNKYNIIGDYDFFLNLSEKFKFKVIQKPVATYRLHQKSLSVSKRGTEIYELNDWFKNNKKKLNNEERIIIKKKITQLNFYNKKFKGNFIETLLFFLKFFSSILNFKNIIILFSPRFFLKKIMWFY